MYPSKSWVAVHIWPMAPILDTFGAVADPGENLTGALHSNFGRGMCGGGG